MHDPAAIACTLTDGDLHDRQQAWLQVATFGRGAMEITGGLAFEFSPAHGVFDSLEKLVRLEADCCAWMTFTLEDLAGKVTMTIRAEGGDGQLAVREAFAPLVDAVGQPQGRTRSD